MSEPNWQRATFYVASTSYVVLVWAIHLAGGECVIAWLNKWQTMIGALIGGGAAITAGRYALHAARLPLIAASDAKIRADRMGRLSAQYAAIDILAAILHDLLAIWRRRPSNFERYSWADYFGLDAQIGTELMVASVNRMVATVGASDGGNRRITFMTHLLLRRLEAAKALAAKLPELALMGSSVRPAAAYPQIAASFEDCLMAAGRHVRECAVEFLGTTEDEPAMAADSESRLLAGKIRALAETCVRLIDQSDFPDAWEEQAAAENAAREAQV